MILRVSKLTTGLFFRSFVTRRHTNWRLGDPWCRSDKEILQPHLRRRRLSAGIVASSAGAEVPRKMAMGQDTKLDEIDREGVDENKELGSRVDVITEGKMVVEKGEEKSDTEVATAEDDKKEEVESHRPGEWFRLTGACSLVLHLGDITKWYKDGKTDAIVNAANEMMLGGGGVDGAIHRAAGKSLFMYCSKVPEVSRGVRCPIGSAVITPGFNLPVAQVIHTVGPMYHREEDPAHVLGKAYKKSVSVAKKSGVKYVAFPAISCGVYGYPYEEAAKVSIQALQESAGDLNEVHFVLFEEGTYRAWLAYAEGNLERLTA